MCERKKGTRVITDGGNGVKRGFFKDGRYRGGLCVGGNDSIRKEKLMAQGNERSAGRKFLRR